MICLSTWTIDEEQHVHSSADIETMDSAAEENAYDHIAILRDASGMIIGTWGHPTEDLNQSFNQSGLANKISSEADGTWVKQTADVAQSLSVIWDLLFESFSDDSFRQNDIIAGYRHFRSDRGIK